VALIALKVNDALEAREAYPNLIRIRCLPLNILGRARNVTSHSVPLRNGSKPEKVILIVTTEACNMREPCAAREELHHL
jgi:hypothetical protein